jgi:hypothetical protein
MSHTYVELGVSKPAYDEIAAKLRAASYDHAFMENGTIDLHGLGLVLDADAAAPAADPAPIAVNVNQGMKEYKGSPVQVGAQVATDSLGPVIVGAWEHAGPAQTLEAISGMMSYLIGLVAQNYSPAQAAQMLRGTADKVEANAPAFLPGGHQH